MINFQAKSLFLKGTEMERGGKLYEAIQYYRRAVQLVPDVEFRLDDSKLKQKEIVNSNDIDQGNICIFTICKHLLSFYTQSE